MTSRLLDVRHDLVWPDTGPVATLRSAAGLSAFLRTGEAPTGEQVREFLVLDPTFPRSMLHSAQRAETAVRGLQMLGGVDDGELVREVGLMRSRLEFAGGMPRPRRDRPARPRHPALGCRDGRSRGRRLLPPGRHDRVEPLMSSGRRLRISHRTGYRYTAPVAASFNEVRMTPRDADGQMLLSHQLQVSPRASVQAYVDYWGALVQSFDVHEEHEVLEILATSLVDVPYGRAAARGRRLGRRHQHRDRRPLGRVPRADRARRRRARGPGARRDRRGAAPRGHARAGGPRRRRRDPRPDLLQRQRDRRDHDRGRGVGGRRRRLPGLLAHAALAAAPARHPGPLRQRLPPRRGGGARSHGRRREPRVDRGVERRLGGLRPHQRPHRSGRRTSSSPAVATTPTSRRSRASTPAARASPSASPSRSPSSPSDLPCHDIHARPAARERHDMGIVPEV